MPTDSTKNVAETEWSIRAEDLAGQILRNATTSILLNLRFLESALFRLQPSPARTTLATNGEKLYYGFEYLFHTYKRESAFLTRGVLHTLMHCIFRHPFVSGLVDAQLWDLASDIAVEAAIEDLGIPTLSTHRSVRQADALTVLKREVPDLTAEKLYRYFLNHSDQRDHFLGMADLFVVCDHSLWYSPPEAEEQDSDDTSAEQSNSERTRDRRVDQEESDQGDEEDQGKQEESGNGDEDGQGEQEESGNGDEDGQDEQEESGNGDGDDQDDQEESGSSDGDGQGEQEESGNGDGDGQGDQDESDQGDADSQENSDSRTDQERPAASGSNDPPTWQQMPQPVGAYRQQLSEMWEDVSRYVQIDMETFSHEAGITAGTLMQELQNLNREKYDYRTFLKRFATRHEELKVNDDEFDYIFYTYGLKLYEKMPLIEPLEYKEEQRIREFVIVIDTSASTSGDLVQTFLQKTYNILMSTETFASRVNLYIIQCDTAIQDVTKITSSKDFETYIKKMQIHGLGGTDFRPAFQYVDELVRSGELSKLKGLIYFTDGYGTFPVHKPDYDAAFVFIRSYYDEPEVPPWAIKLVLEPEEVQLA